MPWTVSHLHSTYNKRALPFTTYAKIISYLNGAQIQHYKQWHQQNHPKGIIFNQNNGLPKTKQHWKQKLWSTTYILCSWRKYHSIQGKIKQKQRKIKNIKSFTPLQTKTLKALQDSKIYIIKPSHKSLGPALLDTKNKHLNGTQWTPTFKRLPTTISLTSKNKNRRHENHPKKLTQKAEQTLFQRSFSFNIEYQYSMAYQKSIKNPLSLWPLVSSIISFLSVFSPWVDQRVNDLLPLVHSYLKNSNTLIKTSNPTNYLIMPCFFQPMLHQCIPTFIQT